MSMYLRFYTAFLFVRLRLLELEQSKDVISEVLGADMVTQRKLRHVIKRPLEGEKRILRGPEYLILRPGIEMLDELRREVLGSVGIGHDITVRVLDDIVYGHFHARRISATVGLDHL